VCCCGQGSLEIGSSLTGYLTLNCSWKTQMAKVNVLFTSTFPTAKFVVQVLTDYNLYEGTALS